MMLRCPFCRARQIALQ